MGKKGAGSWVWTTVSGVIERGGLEPDTGNLWVGT